MKLRYLLLLIALIGAATSFAQTGDTILHSFSTSDGAPASFGSLTLAGSVLYGMTVNGGSEQCGTIFSMNTDASGYAVLHSFTNDGLNSDGASPLGSLTPAGSVLYGMTQYGGIVPPNGPSSNGGTVFSINSDGSNFQVLHGFTGNQITGTDDGAGPCGSVTISGSIIYGMTRFGGASANGIIFSMNTDGSGFVILHSFSGGADDGLCPQGTLTLVGSTLYGMTNGGGLNGEGAVFSMNTDGSGFTLLHSFGTSGSGDGGAPLGDNGLTLVGTILYGMTNIGGANQLGTIFSINTDGTGYGLVHSFDSDEGGGPVGSVILSGSELYGTTFGLPNTLGSVFSMALDGSAFTVVQAFAGPLGDGTSGIGEPALSSDGSTLYGMTESGGSYSNGTVFSVPASGSSTNANLSNILVSAGNPTPAFDSYTTRYTAIVSDVTASITVTPMAAAPGATVTVNGAAVVSGVASPPICLNTGSNTINIIVTAQDGVTTNIYTVTVVRLTNLQNWRLTYLGTAADAGNAADTADGDSNGVPNLMKYAFGLDPTSPASNQIPQTALSGNNFGISFTEPPGISGIDYGAEWTVSLNPPTWTPIPDTGSAMTHIFNMAVGTQPSLFMRLTVTVPLSPIEQLGEDIFFDTTLSNPPGMACATCHSPVAGFTGPNSNVNLTAGPVAGVVPGRFGHRKPQAIGYSTFSPSGPYFNSALQEWVGGNFWDGRAPDNAHQARMPFLDADEMDNTPVGPYPPLAGGYSPLVVQQLANRPYTALFLSVFGANVFQNKTGAVIYGLATQAIAAYEASAEVVPFSSKYDASVNAVPPSNLYQFNPSEENGRQLFFGAAQCSQCHSAATFAAVSSLTSGREVFTMYCYANIGVPANPNNPYYQETDSTNNPQGYNPLGDAYIDYGLGANPNATPGGNTFFSSTPGDIAAFRGLFKAPSLRNVDQRPSPSFVKCYMHNGVFKSLEEVVHFYNKRNIAVDQSGNEVSFDLRAGPPPGFTALFPPPEVMDNVQNVTGMMPGVGGDDTPITVATNGQVGNLGLSAQEEADLVCFLKTLTDGFIGLTPAVAPQLP